MRVFSVSTFDPADFLCLFFLVHLPSLSAKMDQPVSRRCILFRLRPFFALCFLISVWSTGSDGCVTCQCGILSSGQHERRAFGIWQKNCSRLSYASCTASLLSSVWRKVVRNDWFAPFSMMCSGPLVMAASSGLDKCDLVFWLPWLLDMFFGIIESWRRSWRLVPLWMRV